MALILSLETATTNCSVSLSQNGKLLAVKEDNGLNFSHAEKLHVFIEEILKENNFEASQIDAIAVSKGPGSYTGLRIGVSAAKGLCFALEVPLISVSTMKSLAMQVKTEEGFIIPMLDARRMEVYVAGFDNSMNEIFPTRAEVVTEDSFSEFLNLKKTIFIGSGVEKFQEICNHENAHFIENKLPSSAEMAVLAFSKYKISDFEDVAYFEPFYLKDFMLG